MSCKSISIDKNCYQNPIKLSIKGGSNAQTLTSVEYVCENSPYSHLIIKEQYYSPDLIESLELYKSKKIQHPNIIDVCTWWQEDDKIYIIMDYFEAENLGEKIKNNSLPENLDNIFLQILNGVDALNKKQVAHRDLKGDNILLNDMGEIKIIDLDYLVKYDCFCYPKGPPNIQPPEVWKSEDGMVKYDCAFELWAVGILFYLMAGGTPFNKLIGYDILNMKEKMSMLTDSDIEDYIQTIKNKRYTNLISLILKIDPCDRIPIEKAKQMIRAGL